MAASAASHAAADNRPLPAMEATMELGMRLNLLATILSFGFIVAIVFGMI